MIQISKNQIQKSPPNSSLPGFSVGYQKNFETQNQELIRITENNKFLVSVSLIDHPENLYVDSFIFVTNLNTQETLFKDYIERQEITGLVDESFEESGQTFLIFSCKFETTPPFSADGDQKKPTQQMIIDHANQQFKSTLLVGLLQTSGTNTGHILFDENEIKFKFPILEIQRIKQNHFITTSGSQFQFLTLRDSDKSHLGKEIQTLFSYSIDRLMSFYDFDIYRQEYLVVTDPYQSVQLFQFNLEQKKVIPIAQNTTLYHPFSLSFFADQMVVAENNNRIKFIKRNLNPDNDIERIKLQITQTINYGESITVFNQSFFQIPELAEFETEDEQIDLIIFGTDQGSIGQIVNLPQNLYEFLEDLQQSILKVINEQESCLLGFDYNSWKADQKNSNSSDQQVQGNKYIDGDIIKYALSCNKDILFQIIDGMSAIPKPTQNKIENILEKLEQIII